MQIILSNLFTFPFTELAGQFSKLGYDDRNCKSISLLPIGYSVSSYSLHATSTGFHNTHEICISWFCTCAVTQQYHHCNMCPLRNILTSNWSHYKVCDFYRYLFQILTAAICSKLTLKFTLQPFTSFVVGKQIIIFCITFMHNPLS